MKVFHVKFFKKIKSAIREEIALKKKSDTTIGLSLALGVFIAFTPIWGFQTLTSIGLSTLFRLNRVLSVSGTSISFVLAPFIAVAGYKTGKWLFPNTKHIELNYDNLAWDTLKDDIFTFVIGTMTNGFIVALLTFVTVLSLVKLFRYKRENNQILA